MDVIHLFTKIKMIRWRFIPLTLNILPLRFCTSLGWGRGGDLPNHTRSQLLIITESQNFAQLSKDET